ncbi:unnamed protein product [Oikopleura dioica]|uniref:Helicase C-terminal domain-containing protein n=1 Tax=Oikopleura dioica TaxID=34765 RepID=E4Z190_OIKDI|nr:unnamed protein product [Oikopleura dioica]
MRIDGSCGSMEREKIIKKFTDFPLPSILIISTRAGCVGINVTAATRVVMFDVSWNPVHDAQAVCRIYRIGQEKACFIYRLVADGCMERAIYERQVAKTSLSRRIVDEKNIDRLRVDSNRALLIFQDQSNLPPPPPMTAEEAGDSVIEEVSRECGKYLSHTPIKMESLIVESKQQLTASEKRIAKRQYESEKNTSGGYGCGRGRPRAEHRPIAHVRPFQSGNSHGQMPGMPNHHITTGLPSWRHAAMNMARQGTPPFNPNGSPSLLGNLPFPNPLLSPRHSGSPSHDSSTNHRETVSFGPPVPAEEQNFLNDFPVHGSSMPQNCSSSNAVLPPSSDFSNLLRNPAFNQPRLDNVSSIMQFLKDGYNTSAALDLQRHRDQTSLNLAGIIPQAPPGGTIDIIDSD